VASSNTPQALELTHSISLLVSDSMPLAQLYPGWLSTRKLGNPFQVTLEFLIFFS
jgi:hypothetical protein